DANSLGGTIQVESLSAFDHDGLFYTAAVEGGYDEKREEYSPKVSGAVSQKFSLGSGTDNFGVAAALSWQERTFGSDNVETGGKWEDGLLEETEMRQYDIERERLGAGLNFDFRPNKNSEYYLRTLYS
ncbi:TonB-dependent receptor, partial [Pseudomonas aeruginosa]